MYTDIFTAAQEALEITDKVGPNDTQTAYSLEKIREVHPRAYEKWDTAEDEKLKALFVSGNSTENLADALQRQKGAIQSQLRKLGLVE